jgi:hypothetical protein
MSRFITPTPHPGSETAFDEQWRAQYQNNNNIKQTRDMMVFGGCLKNKKLQTGREICSNIG